MFASMTATMHSPDEIAEMLGLHVRTVRGYVRDGRLPATRIGKQYRISDRDLREFLGDTSTPTSTPKVEATTIVQIDAVGRELMDRITNLVVAAATRAHVQTVYNETQDSLKIITVGDPADAAELLGMVSALVKDAQT